MGLKGLKGLTKLNAVDVQGGAKDGITLGIDGEYLLCCLFYFTKLFQIEH